MPRVARRAGIARNAGAAAAVLLALVVPPLHALELRVLSAGAVEPGMRPALAAFEARQRSTRSASSSRRRRRCGRRCARPPVADVIVVPQGALDELAATGAPSPGRARRSARRRRRRGAPGVRRPTSAAPTRCARRCRAEHGRLQPRVDRRLRRADAAAARRRRRRPAEVGARRRRRVGDAAPARRNVAREFGFGALTEIALFRDQG
jgi:molybdate transport system substrate-binding protein